MPTLDRRLLRALAAALCLSLMLAGCANVATAPSPAQQTQAAQAQTLYRQGRFNDAAQLWQQLAQANWRMRDAWLLRAAESYRQLDDWTQVAPLLARIQRARLDPAQAQRFDLLSAETSLNRGQLQRALAAAEAMAAFPPALQPRVLELQARAQQALGQPLAAARTRLRLDRDLSGFDRAQNEQQLLALLQAMPGAQLQSEARALAPNDPLRPWLAQALSRQGSALATPLPQLDHPVGTMLPGSGQADVREGYRPPHAIALLLPISGPLAPAAKALQDGFTIAENADPKRAAETTVSVYDTGGTPGGALAAYQQAVANHPDIVVGPLGREAVGTLFQQPLPVPLLALNHPDNGVPPPGSAEFALPPEADGAHAAARMRSQGLHTAIMFIGEGDSEQRAARAFRAQFESMGGQVLGSATLPRDEVNYADDIATLTANAGSDTGIFLALRPRQGRLLVPQLNIAQVTLPVYATSHIYGAEENQGLDRDLDGVQFCDAPWLFDAQPGLPLRSKLQATMPDTVGPAARLFAFGMDAWSLLPYLDWLRNHPGSYLAGATGQLTMDSFGRIQRTPIWAQFVDGIAVPMTGALDASDGSAMPGTR
ncbi:MAG TPA: penicillin-binding protein activator [Rhodanobacteraceae bacterium]|nr:penicillin-binding protein activator [Rhodanobacteraceae bacterium]